MELHNKKTNETINITFRPFEVGDEKEVIACIKDEYGDTYFKKDFYQPDFIVKEHQNGHIHFMIAETDDHDIAGFMILKRFLPEEQMIEIASQIFKKKYRGFGMAEKIFDYAMAQLETMDCSCIYCLPVTFHDISQRLMARQGLKGTGFVLSLFDMNTIKQSYGTRKCHKHGQTVQVLAKDKKDAGVLYIPQEHEAFTTKIYNNLGVDFAIADASASKEPEPSSSSVLKYTLDENNAYLAIHIMEPGADLKEQIHLLMHKFQKIPHMTYNIFLNVNHPCSVSAYETLTEMGYFFTGYKALCSEREFMILHNPMDVELDFDDFVLSEEFKKILNYIIPFYEKRKERL